MQGEKVILSIETTVSGAMPEGGNDHQAHFARHLSINKVMAESYTQTMHILDQASTLAEKGNDVTRDMIGRCVICILHSAEQRINEIVTNGEYKAKAIPCSQQSESTADILMSLLERIKNKSPGAMIDILRKAAEDHYGIPEKE